MDLFSVNVDKEYPSFKKLMGEWRYHFPFNFLQLIDNLYKKLYSDRPNNYIHPVRYEEMRIYKDCDLKDIKVVILGQDPYYNGNDTGYAFACKYKMSPSLKNIRQAIFNNVGHRRTADLHDMGLTADKSLEYLVKQGVFLLNTRLTVIDGKPLSHKGYGWEPVIDETIKIINTKPNIVWMLWGNEAQSFESKIINKSHKILKSSHPVSRNQDVWFCSDFLECNKFLIKNKIKPILW